MVTRINGNRHTNSPTPAVNHRPLSLSVHFHLSICLFFALSPQQAHPRTVLDPNTQQRLSYHVIDIDSPHLWLPLKLFAASRQDSIAIKTPTVHGPAL
jgi:hypothetical protein